MLLMVTAGACLTQQAEKLTGVEGDMSQECK